MQLYKHGMAYRKEAPASWCPSCKTVLANEQVIAGKCERCDSMVGTRKMPQWFLKITDYAERLLENLQTIDWSERTKTAQYNWIGKSTGYRLKFKVQGLKSSKVVEVFTTRPDTLFGATYLVLAPEHKLVVSLFANHESLITNKEEVKKYIEKAKKQTQATRTREDKEKTGVELKGIIAKNPANNEEIPVWIADYVLDEYGTGAVMAVPCHDSRDFAFAKKFGLPMKQVILPTFSKSEIRNAKSEINYNDQSSKQECQAAYEGEGVLVNSGKFNGFKSEEARKKIGEFVGGDPQVHYHLRDWLISRQRYWGAPIPIIYCDKCGTVPVPEKDLPVELPYVEDFHPTGTDKSPLTTVHEFVNAKCPKCGGTAQRETDVSDTFLDSAWYYLRYPNTGNGKEAWDKSITKKWLPVDMYIGGQEHAVLHLMYVRFIAMFLHDQNFIDFEEPFKKFRAHGLLIKAGAKISKSRGNIVNPDEFFDMFGADTVRTYLMFLSPLTDGGDWRDEGIRGIYRWFNRVWKLAQSNHAGKGSEELEKLRHKTIKKVTEDIERLHYNTAISSLMEYVNEISNGKGQLSNIYIETLLVLLAPFAPYFTEELWEQVVGAGSVHDQKWPVYNPELIEEETIIIPVQVNGKVRAEIEVASNATEKEMEDAALVSEKVQKYLGGKQPKRVIAVKGKLVNIVV